MRTQSTTSARCVSNATATPSATVLTPVTRSFAAGRTLSGRSHSAAALAAPPSSVAAARCASTNLRGALTRGGGREQCAVRAAVPGAASQREAVSSARRRGNGNVILTLALALTLTLTLNLTQA